MGGAGGAGGGRARRVRTTQWYGYIKVIAYLLLLIYGRLLCQVGPQFRVEAVNPNLET